AYALEALQWLKDDGVVASLDVEAWIVPPDRLYMTIAYQRPDADTTEYQKFYQVWEV
ncbi:hypothetical protein C6511_26145, partial [Escherichia coli]|uniref:phage GP46 family protein n=2 Tax=Enterobacteriaceae TaxID=543 RepID=UPI0015D107A0